MRNRALIRYLLFGFAALAACCLHAWLYPYVNPTAALRMRVHRTEAIARAEAFLRQELITVPAGYQCVASFQTESTTKAYLEQTLGLAKANRVMQSEGYVFFWRVRWFRSGSQEEYRVFLDPAGRLLAFHHLIPDDRQSPMSMQPEQAARRYLERVTGDHLEEYVRTASSTTPQVKRTDFAYTWERKNARLGEAKQRLSVTVTGDRVLMFTRGIRLPTEFTLYYNKERQKGSLLANIANAFYALFILAGIIGLVIGITRRSFYWKSSLAAAILITAVTLLNQLNMLPLSLSDFDTAKTYLDFWSDKWIGIGVGLAIAFFTTVFVVGSAEWFYRRSFPAHAPVHWWFTRAGFSSAGGRKRILLGFGILFAPPGLH